MWIRVRNVERQQTQLLLVSTRSPNVGSMLGQRRRRWANIEPTLSEHLVFAGRTRSSYQCNIYSRTHTVDFLRRGPWCSG